VFAGWEVNLPEEPWASKALDSQAKRYPITNLFDGDLATAWVFEGKKWHGRGTDSWDRPLTGTAFLGGVGQWIELHSRSADPPLIDAIGIVNGYAKSPGVYKRNNRITRIRLDAGGGSWEPRWTQTFELRPVMWMQIIDLPEMSAGRLRITVEEVAFGPDNDLCISEIQLYHEGHAVIPRPTPFVLCSPGAACGCFGSLELSDSRCRRVSKAEDTSIILVSSFYFSPNGRAAVLFGNDSTGERVVAVVNFTNGQHLFRGTLDPYPVDARWLSDEEFEVTTLTFEDEGRTEHRYRVDLRDVPPRFSPAPN
jgi:hypothetical protein